MSFLTVNGIAIPAATESYSEEIREIGGNEAAYDGTMRQSRQTTKHDISLDTTYLTGADALAWDGFIRGLGHHWSFDSSFYSGKGLGPNAGYVATQSASSGKFGGRLIVTATTGTITFAAQLGSNWTAMFWRLESGTWHHYAILSSGTKYKDGVAGSYTTTWFTVSGGSATITNSTGSAVEYDDLVLLPYLIIASWAATFGVATTAFSELGDLFLAGDAVREQTTRTAVGSISQSTFTPGVISGTRYTDLRKLSVKLEEK